MNYDEMMKYLMSIGKFGSNYGLMRMEKMLEILGNPHEKFKSIHVAGTNGKGSTTAMISKILIENGYKIGMYTSPYLEVFEERIQINGVNISKDDLTKIMTKVYNAIQEGVKLGYEEPTWFEVITLGMFIYFSEQNVDYAVIEVGLGGRLDATNVINPVLSVITSISYDHMDILGNTLGEIAFEKGGIIKENVPVIIYPQAKEVLEVLEKICKDKNCEIINVNEESTRLIKINDDNTQKIEVTTSIIDETISIIDKNPKQSSKYEVDLALLGKHQLLNCSTAIHVVEKLKCMGLDIKKSSINDALKKVIWPGRLEILGSNPLVVIDGAHNIDGVNRLKESVETYFKYDKLILILGILGDKEVEKMVNTIAPLASHIIVVSPHNERAGSPEILKGYIDKCNISSEIVEGYKEAYLKACSIVNKGDLILISGSLYMIGDMRTEIKKIN